MFCNVFLAAIQICDPYRGNESFQCSCEPFGAPASAFRGQDMLHRPSDDAQRSLQALPGDRSDIDSNGTVKQVVAADLPASPTEIAGRDRRLSSVVLSSDTRSGKSSSGLSQNNDSNMVCEAIRANALVKYIIDRNRHNLGKFSVGAQTALTHLVTAANTK